MNGDYQLEDTVYIPFTTRAFATGIPTALVSGEVQIYEDASVTQITAAETLTVSLDSIAGFNMVAVAATAANGFGAGQSYTLVLSAGTVGGVSVIGEVVGQFTLDMSAAAKDLANGTDGLGAIKAETALIVADTNELQSDDVPGLIATLDAVVDTVKADTAAILVDTADMQPKLGTPAADVSADIAAIKAETALIVADTNELQTDDVPGLIATLDAVVDTVKVDTAAILVDTGTDIPARFDGIEGATFSTATDSLEAIRDRGDAAWTTGAGGTPPQLLQSTTIATLASQTSFTLTAGSADDDAYNGAIVVVTDQSTSTQKAVGTVSDYTGSTKTVTLSADPGIFTMATGDTIEVIAALGTGATAADIRAEIDSNSTQLAAIVADTNELQTDDVPGLIATLDAVVDTVKVDTAAILVDTADMQPKLGSPAADVSADIAAVKAETALIVADTNELQTDDYPTSIAALQADLDTLTAGVNVTQINGVAAAAAGLALSADTIVNGTASGTPTTTTMVSDVSIAVNDQLNGRTIIFADDTTTAALQDQATDITACTAATNTLTFTALTTAPVSGDTFVIV